MSLNSATRFEILARDPATRARAGLLHTPHGTIATPALLPVGTQASVKALGPDDLQTLGVHVSDLRAASGQRQRLDYA